MNINEENAKAIKKFMIEHSVDLCNCSSTGRRIIWLPFENMFVVKYKKGVSYTAINLEDAIEVFNKEMYDIL